MGENKGMCNQRYLVATPTEHNNTTFNYLAADSCHGYIVDPNDFSTFLRLEDSETHFNPEKQI